MKIFKISSVILAVALVSLMAVLFAHFKTVSALQAQYDFSGWMWSSNYGWISLNSGNFLPDTKNYKVILGGANTSEVSGWGWSSNVGWICFGKDCDPDIMCKPGDFDCKSKNECGGGGGKCWAKFDASNNLTGWAKVISLNNEGWIHLGMGKDVNPPPPGFDCYDCAYDTSTPPRLLGNGQCKSCFTATKVDGLNIPASETLTAVEGSGAICSNCSVCKEETASRVVCSTCLSCKEYGGVKNTQTGGLVGWGWNGNNGQASKTGAGWIKYNSKSGGSGIVYPWVQTLYGSVFSSSGIRQKSEVAGKNATYCIFAKSAVNFVSSNCDALVSDVNIDFPAQNNFYKNILGRLDLDGLTKIDKTSKGINYNKYGNVIATVSDQLPTVLNNKVYVTAGDLTISSAYEIANSIIPSQKGNGIVVVDGNLIINKDITYQQTATLTDLKQLASIAWVVKGDVIIDPAVKQVAGAFLVLGDGKNDCQFSDGSECNGTQLYPKYLQNGYGTFFSGRSESVPLTVYGLLMAKAFDFERLFASIGQGSEKIIYDGRLIANPPPGMKSLLEGLPLIRDFDF